MAFGDVKCSSTFALCVKTLWEKILTASSICFLMVLCLLLLSTSFSSTLWYRWAFACVLWFLGVLIQFLCCVHLDLLSGCASLGGGFLIVFGKLGLSPRMWSLVPDLMFGKLYQFAPPRSLWISACFLLCGLCVLEGMGVFFFWFLLFVSLLLTLGSTRVDVWVDMKFSAWPHWCWQVLV